MARVRWYIFGVVTGAIVTASGMLLWRGVQPEPAAQRLRELAGVVLPPGSRLEWSREEGGGFRGEGLTVHEFNVPADALRAWVAKCPSGFSAGRLDATNVWRHLAVRGLRGSDQACTWEKQSPAQYDNVVITGYAVYHLCIEY